MDIYTTRLATKHLKLKHRRKEKKLKIENGSVPLSQDILRCKPQIMAKQS